MAWTIYGLVTSQVGYKNDVIEIPGAGNMTVKAFLKLAMGFEQDFLPVVAVVHLVWIAVFLFVFAYAIKFINFQRR